MARIRSKDLQRKNPPPDEGLLGIFMPVNDRRAFVTECRAQGLTSQKVVSALVYGLMAEVAKGKSIRESLNNGT